VFEKVYGSHLVGGVFKMMFVTFASDYMLQFEVNGSILLYLESDYGADQVMEICS